MQRRLLTGATCLFLAATAARAESDLAARLVNAAPTADPAVLELAARAAECAGGTDSADTAERLAVIDYSRPSSEPRLWVFDLRRGRLLFEELVAHGRGTGERLAERFSNVEGSHMSSLGLFRATNSYDGSNGYSLRLQGLEPGFNDRAFERAIVMHGAPYVSQDLVRKQGRIGRSWGCPAVRSAVARRMIDTLKHGALLFAYYPDRKWLEASPYLQCGAAPGGATLRTHAEPPAIPSPRCDLSAPGRILGGACPRLPTSTLRPECSNAHAPATPTLSRLSIAVSRPG